MNALECEIHCDTTIHAMKQLQWRRLQLQQGDVAAAPSPLKLHWALTELSRFGCFFWIHWRWLGDLVTSYIGWPSRSTKIHSERSCTETHEAECVWQLECTKMQLVCRLLQRVGQPGSGCSSLSTVFSTYPSPSLGTPFFVVFFLGGDGLSFCPIFSTKNRIFKHKIWCQAMKLSNVRISCLNSNGQAAGPKAERPNELRIESDPMIFVKIGQSSNQRTSTH